MGRFAAEDMIAHSDIDTALRWHLQSNHYPPVPLAMVDACKAAIAAGRDGNWDESIDLPPGVRWRGHTAAPASAIIDAHHLESFLQDDEDNDN